MGYILARQYLLQAIRSQHVVSKRRSSPVDRSGSGACGSLLRGVLILCKALPMRMMRCDLRIKTYFDTRQSVSTELLVNIV